MRLNKIKSRVYRRQEKQETREINAAKYKIHDEAIQWW
jgi:hypothetical protein